MEKRDNARLADLINHKAKYIRGDMHSAECITGNNFHRIIKYKDSSNEGVVKH